MGQSKFTNLETILSTVILVIKGLLQAVSNNIVFVPCVLLRVLVIIFVKVFRKNYRLLSYMGVLMEDDFTRNASNLSQVSILTLDGELTLAQVKVLFEKNVLDCEHPERGRLRYPELQMYLVRLLGTWCWKPDSNFKIEDHIYETTYSEKLPPPDKIFQDNINGTYPVNKSPWELSLVKSNPGCGRSLLVLKIHHSMGDGKSMVKLIVECLAGKKLKTASVIKTPSKPLIDKFSYWISLTYYTTMGIYVKNRFFQLYTRKHPWRIQNKNTSPYIVGTTEKLFLQDMKSIAKKNSVSTSSVIMALITGAIRSYDEKAASVPGGLFMYCTLPKPNHPHNFTNHFLVGHPFLPTDICDAGERLQNCNVVYLNVKQNNFPGFLDIGAQMLANIVSPLCKYYFPKDSFAAGLTNIAGDEEGFSVGGCVCTDFNFCVSTIGSAAGLVFSIFSYKDSIRVTVLAKSSILTEKQVSKLANLVETELQVLKSL